MSRSVPLAVVLLWCARAEAAPPRHTPTVAAIALPARDDAVAARRAARLGEAAAARRGARGVALPDAGEAARGALLARAHELFLKGDVDAAAASYDAALADVARRPDAGDPASLVAAHVERVQIALARGESELAGTLLTRLMRWDGAFAPTPAEATPAVTEAVARAGEGEAVRAPLGAGDAGEACRAVDDLLVVRRTREGQLEVVRLEHCQVRGVTTAGAGAADQAVLDALFGAAAAELAAVGRPAPADRAAPARSLVGRPWFWIAVGAAAVAATAGGLWLARDRGDADGFDVAIRF